MNEKNALIVDVIIKPAVLAIFAVIVGYFWEIYKFEKEVKFSKRIDLLMENRKKVSDIYIVSDFNFKQIRSNEINPDRNKSDCSNDWYSVYINEMKAQAVQLNYIEALDKNIIENDSLVTYIDDYKYQLRTFDSTINRNLNCQVVTNSFPKLTSPLEKIIELHTTIISDMVK